MAIQTVNLAVPNGDTPRSANTKINANFSDQTHAASRLVGTAAEQVPLAKDAFKAAFSNSITSDIGANAGRDCNTFAHGERYTISGIGNINTPPVYADNYFYYIETIGTSYAGDNNSLQIAYGYTTDAMFFRRQTGGIWGDWVSMNLGNRVYSATTADAPNVAIGVDGIMKRSTSSERYKDILAPLVLDNARYEDAMALNPIIYRSLADADNPAYHYYSFSAEELGAYDPAFTLWRETETVVDDEGNGIEQPFAERQAEGININALLAMSHAIAIKQDAIIKALEARVAALEKV